MQKHDQPRLGNWATWGLVAAWAIHDLEELATMASWGRRTARRLARSRPGTPAWVLDSLDRSQSEVAVAIGLVGTSMGAAAAVGAATNGRHPTYRTAVAGFGLHGLAHSGQSVLWRGYTPGVVTAPLVVIPYAVAFVMHWLTPTTPLTTAEQFRGRCSLSSPSWSAAIS